MTEPATPQLTEDAVREIETRRKLVYAKWHEPSFAKRLLDQDIPALIRDWRAMRARIETLTTEWCECGHARDKHQFFSDHDECYECDQASPDLCCEWRPAPRPNENAALREQLAAAESEVRGVLAALGDNAIHSHPDGGTENIYESLAISVARLQSQLAQVASERDEARRELEMLNTLTDHHLRPEIHDAIKGLK